MDIEFKIVQAPQDPNNSAPINNNLGGASINL
jgi:hypothetical protein